MSRRKRPQPAAGPRTGVAAIGKNLPRPPPATGRPRTRVATKNINAPGTAAVKTKTTGMIATWLTTIGTRSTRPRVDRVVPNAAAIRVVIGGPTRGTHGTILAVMAAVAEGQDRHVTIAIIGIDPREDREAALGHLCPGGEGIREVACILPKNNKKHMCINYSLLFEFTARKLHNQWTRT